jgi:hypothetical protein
MFGSGASPSKAGAGEGCTVTDGYDPARAVPEESRGTAARPVMTASAATVVRRSRLISYRLAATRMPER